MEIFFEKFKGISDRKIYIEYAETILYNYNAFGFGR